MKILSLIFLMAVFPLLEVSAATKVRPTKCLFSNNNGTIGEYLCVERNSKIKVNIAGVCLYDKGWKRGTVYPLNPKAKRFTVTKVCDKGVEFAAINDSDEIKGPKIFGSPLVTANKNSFSSSLTVDETRYADQVPYTCYTNQVSTTGASIAPVACAAPGMVNACYLVKFASETVIGSRKFTGYWWVKDNNPSSATLAVTPCIGGVQMGAPVSGSKLGKIITGNSTTPLADDEDPIFCIIKSGNVVTKRLCSQLSCSWKSGGCCRQVMNVGGTLWWGRQKSVTPTILDKLNTLTASADILGLNISTTQYEKCDEVRVIKTFE